jgi:ABC-type uncharacterized transport system substrate-binding protein
LIKSVEKVRGYNMASVGNPVELGLVASLARPGGNVTGQSNTPGPEFSGKQLEILKEAVPALSRVGVFWNSTFQMLQGLETAAQALGLTVLLADVQQPEHVDAAFAILDQRAHLRRNIRLQVTLFSTISCMAMEKRSNVTDLILNVL